MCGTHTTKPAVDESQIGEGIRDLLWRACIVVQQLTAGFTLHSRVAQPWTSDLGQLFFQQLLVIEIRVVAVKGDQFLMCAELHDASRVQHRNEVCVPNG